MVKRLLNFFEWRRYRGWEVVLIHLALLVPAFTALALSFTVTTEQLENGEVQWAPVCSYKRYLNVQCPSCGLTRAFCSLSHGEWGRAVSYNALSPVWYGCAVLVTVVGLLSATTYALRRFEVIKGKTKGEIG